MFGVIWSKAVHSEIVMESAFGTQTTQRLADLRRSVRRYQDRYGELAGMIDLKKANDAMASRQRRLAKLAEEAARIEAEMHSMSSEVQRIERWVEFCLEDVIERAKRDHAEGWSPAPVLGYRLWGVGNEFLYGVKIPWESRTLEATCLAHRGSDEIPHTDGRCGRLGCGVYAAKTVAPLYTEFDVSAIGDLAIGLVALTGKVVEHVDGYRGAAATVVALGVSVRRHLLLTSDPMKIDGVFADPSVVICAPEVRTQERRLQEMEAFVTNEARRARPWTSVINNE